MEVIDSKHDQALRFSATVRDWLLREHITLDFVERQTLDLAAMWRDSRPFARAVWVVASSGPVAQLYFVDPERQQLRMRELPLSNGLDEYGCELLAQVIAVAAAQRVDTEPSQSWLDDDQGSVALTAAAPRRDGTNGGPPRPVDTGAALVSKDQARAPRSETWPPRDQSEATTGQLGRAHAGVYYGVSLRGGEGTLHGPGVSASVPLSPARPTVDVNLRVQYLMTQSIKRGTTSLQIAAFPVRVTSGVNARLSERASLGFEVGGGVDVVDFSIADEALDVSGNLTEVRPVLMLLGKAGVDASFGHVYFAAGVDWQLQATRYLGESDQGELVELVGARRMQPLLQAGWSY